MTRIGILAGCLGRQDGGPETYERELIRAIATTDRANEYSIYSFNGAAAACVGPLPQNMSLKVLRPRNRWISLALTAPARILSDRLKLLHAPLYPPPLCPAPLVFTMHDTSPIAHPEFFTPAIYRRLNPLVRSALRKARVVICVSRHALESTAEIVGLDRKRMVVVPHGVDPKFQREPDAQTRAAVRERLKLKRPYVLYVGKIMQRKNLVRMIEGVARLREATGADIEFVMVGKRLYDNGEIDRTIENLDMTGHVRELGHVADEDLPVLYADALIFLYVTLWEGFGLPLLEAMASGTPVITSNVSSLPEVAGDAALLVDPLAVEEITDALMRLTNDQPLRQELIARGRTRAAQFTWARTAEQTIRAYQMAAEQ